MGWLPFNLRREASSSLRAVARHLSDSLAARRLVRPTATIHVQVKLIGMVDGRYLSVSQTVGVPQGATPVQALAALVRTGAIDKTVFRKIKNLRPPFFVVLNDVKQEKNARRIALHEDDVLAVMQLAAGG